jgi:hypothetical protein
MSDTFIKTSELSSRNILISPNTQFLILDKGVLTQSEAGSTMTTPASAVLALVAGAYNLNNLSNLFINFASQSANNLSNYTTVNNNSALTWNYQGTDIKVLSANWQNTYSTVNANSSLWILSGGSSGSESDPVFTSWATTNSANFVETFNTVRTNSALNWNYQGTDVRVLTANYSSNYNTVNSLSSTWGGGSSLFFPGEAWVTTDGNNSTAILGDPSKPFRQPQDAYDAGANVLHIGIGTFNGIAINASADITLIGVGFNQSIVGGISLGTGFDGNDTLTIRGNGTENISIVSIYLTLPTGTNGTNGESAGANGNGTNGSAGINSCIANVNDITINGNIDLFGSLGGNGGNGYSGYSESCGAGGNGGTGGNGWDLYITNCVCMGYVALPPGIGGNGGNGGSSYDSTYSGGGAGNGGNAGNAGTLTLKNTKVSGLASVPPGVGGTQGIVGTGNGNGSPGSDGSSTSAGTIYARWSELASSPAYSESTDIHYSSLVDSWTA